MKKSSAFIMLVPGLVILLVFLAFPLLKVLVPSMFEGEYPFSSYLEFLQDSYYMKIFLRTVRIAVITTLICMIGEFQPRILSVGAVKSGEAFCWRHPFSR